MNIIVITITARTEPRLEEMAATLAASAARSPTSKVSWIVVDELMGDPKRDARWFAIVDKHGHAGAIDDMARIPPLYTEHRIVDPEEPRPQRPAHNSARSAGLMMALGGLDTDALDDAYVVFLNDCAVVTADFISVAADLAKQGLGWRCPSFLDHDVRVRIPENGELRWRDSSDSLHPVPPATVPGVCWGAPARSLARIQGFDLSYDGEDKGHDLDAVLRLARVGIKFVTTKRACVVSLRRTKLRDEISTDRVAFAGARNQALLRRLAAEPLRVLPLERARRSAMDVPPPRSEPEVSARSTATDGEAPVARPQQTTDGSSPVDEPVMELPATDGASPEEGAPNVTQAMDGASPEDAPQVTQQTTDGPSPADEPVKKEGVAHRIATVFRRKSKRKKKTDGAPPEAAPQTTKRKKKTDGAPPEAAPQTTIGTDVDEQFDDGELGEPDEFDEFDDEHSGR